MIPRQILSRYHDNYFFVSALPRLMPMERAVPPKIGKCCSTPPQAEASFSDTTLQRPLPYSVSCRGYPVWSFVFGRKFTFLQKISPNFSQSYFFGDRVDTGLSAGYTLNGAAQSCRQLSRNLSWEACHTGCYKTGGKK
jgi:hypothetical protein